MAVVLVLSLLPTAAWAADFPGSGSGTQADPYVITTAEELDAVRNDLDGYYKLGNDIDLSETDYAGAWTPIGAFVADGDSSEIPDANYAFNGTFDGKDYTISGLTVEGTACVGLFGVVANGTVKDLNIEDATVSGNTMTAAAIGYAYNSTVDDVDLTGTNTITSTLDAAAVSPSIPRPYMVAGVVGAGMDSTISNCDVTGTTLTMASDGTATAWGTNAHDAGLVGGGLEGCNVDRCSASDSSVIVDGAYCFGIGGLSGCAISAESVTDCTVTDVTLTVGDNAYLVGGLMGYTGQDGDNAATQVSDCSADTDITVGEDSSRIGGLIGGGFYLDLYKAYYPVPSRFDLIGCSTSGTISAGAGSEAVGTVVGYACLCDTAGGTSTMAGDVVGTDQSAFAGGSGTEGDPYQISNAAQLYAMRYDLEAYYQLAGNIDLDELTLDFGNGSRYIGWKPVGVLTYSSDVNMDTGEMDLTKVFSGSLDGGNYKISNVNVTTNGDLLAVGGLFDCFTGTVKDLTVENVTVNGDGTTMAAGGVVGYAMSGTVSNVTLTGTNTVTGTNCVGGIAGGSSAEIAGCTVEGTTEIVVIGDNDFSNGRIIQCDVAECGGLVVGGGFNGSVKNCAATGTVTATGNEPVGLGGIGGCLQCMTEISGNTATVTITTSQGGHAIGGLCGYAGMGDDGSGTVADPCQIFNNTVNVTINAPGATHVGGLVGTGLYFYGMEDRFAVTDCTVTGTITAGTDATSPYGVTTPGAVAGRAVGSTVADSCIFTGLTINGAPAANKVGITSLMYESADQYDDDVSGALLYGLTDTYQPLFEGAIFNEDYAHYWHDYCAAILGEANADAAVSALKFSIGGELYGQDAVDAYTENPESTQFFCGFTGNVATLTFNGSQISGYDANGTELFSHPYRYVGEESLYMGTEPLMDAWLFESLDDNSGQFKYFLMCGDTPDTTYHIEFRYGSERGDNLNQFATGNSAYWLAAGIPTSALEDEEETLLEQVIALFCLENMDYSLARTSSSLAQISDLVGTWDYYVSGQAQPDTLYIVIDTSGNGHTYYMGQNALNYQVFAYDNDGSASVKSGIYVARADEPQAAKYTITTNSAGKTIFTLTGEDEGQAFAISYVKRTSTTPDDHDDSDSGSSESTSGTTVPVSGTTGVSASVSGGTATVKATDAQIKAITSGTGADGTVSIDVSSLKVNTVVVPVKLVSAANSTASLEVVLPTGSVTLDKDALASVAGKGDIKISVETISNSALTDGQRDVLGAQADSAVVVDVTIFVNGSKTSAFGDGKLQISVPYTLRSGESPDSITVWFLKDDGTIEPKNGTYHAATGCVEFTTDHLSRYLVVSFPFKDVAENAWYYGSVAYAYNNSLFAGTGTATFSPDMAMTRQMIWMVLARMDGRTPADMDAARAWAVENGISDGTNPTNAITREQMAAILYRYAQYKHYDTTQGGMAIREFADQGSISEYALPALAWAVNAGLMEGSGNHIMPSGSATRAQVATILQRFCQNVAG